MGFVGSTCWIRPC